jgi:hypothetical protein
MLSRGSDFCEAKAPGRNAEALGQLLPRSARYLSNNPELLYPCATALNEDYQHDDKKRSGNRPDNVGSVHINFLPS